METEKQLISHLYQNKENGKWIIQTNDEHQRGVAEMATSYSGLFGLPSWGHTLGMLHDKGKERDAFQQYIRTTSGLPVTDEKSYGEHHHAFVGGILVTNLMGKSVFNLLANQIISHHTGLQPYIVFKHKDISREHLHIVSLRVDENVRKISDSHEYDRSMSVLRELERKYGLHLAPGKDSVQRERLREPDKTKYEIYDAIKGCLPKCKSWNDLEGRLKEQGIDVRYKYCGNTDRKQGVLFSKNDFEFSGLKIDRQFSFSKLNRHFAYAQQQTQHRSAIVKDFHAAAGTYHSAFSGLFGTGGGKTDTDRPTINFGGNIGELPLPPNNSPVELSFAQL